MPGASATRFQPDLGVTRAQMALILIAAAGPAGIDVPAAREQGFKDIGGLPGATRDAINQLARLGYHQGHDRLHLRTRPSGEPSPDGPVLHPVP